LETHVHCSTLTANGSALATTVAHLLNREKHT